MDQDYLQAVFYGMAMQLQEARSETQMTLGNLIEALEKMPSGSMVANLHSVHSYRGYYEDLAFELGEGVRPAADLLSECRAVMGKALTGYKGGEFVMGEKTPVWVAPQDTTGDKLMRVGEDGLLETEGE